MRQASPPEPGPTGRPAGGPVPGGAPLRPRRPSTVGGMVYLVVALAEAVGLLVVAFGPWRHGIALMGLGLGAAALARALLRDGAAGMLAVRSRWFDVVSLGAVAVALVVLSFVVPAQVGL